jgi:hypothetical protein
VQRRSLGWQGWGALRSLRSGPSAFRIWTEFTVRVRVRVRVRGCGLSQAPSEFGQNLPCQPVKRVSTREKCHWSHACTSFKRACVGTNGILTRVSFCRKTRTVHSPQVGTSFLPPLGY